MIPKKPRQPSKLAGSLEQTSRLSWKAAAFFGFVQDLLYILEGLEECFGTLAYGAWGTGQTDVIYGRNVFVKLTLGAPFGPSVLCNL